MVPVREPAKLARLDPVQPVVAARQALQGLSAGDLKPFRLESGALEHVEEQFQRAVEVLLQAIDRTAAGRRPDARADARREKGRFLVEVLGAEVGGAARAHLAAGESGQAGALGRHLVSARAQREPYGHQRQLVVFY